MERVYDWINRRLAISISTYPCYYLVITLLLSAFLSSSLFHCTFEDDIRRSFSPPKSRASREEHIFTHFFNITNIPQRAFIVFHAKDGGTMLRPEHIREMYQIDKMMTDVLENADHWGVPMCHPICHLNTAISIFWKEFSRNENNTDFDENAVFAFPVSTIYGQELFIGGHLFGVESSDHIFPNRSSIIRVETIVLWYSAQIDNPRKRQLLRNTTLGLFEMSKQKSTTKLINFNIFGDEIANSEMIRGAFEATKLMIIGFFLLLGFVFMVVWRKVEPHRLPHIVFAIVFSPFLAATVSFGIISWLRLPIYSIMCVTPFLILGIGVDDAFIMLQSWSHLRKIPCRKERMAQVFVEIGPSISITSITNMIAFGIGYLTPTPQMSLFCLCTSMACLFDYVFTFTLLAPVIFMTEKTEDGYILAQKLSKKNESSEWCIAEYSKLVCSWRGRTLVVALLMSLYFLSAVGVLKMKSTFEPAKAFPSDSPLASSLGSVRRIFNDFFPLQIIVNKPPNISDPSEHTEFDNMVRAVETVPNSYGSNRTMLFLRTYEDFDRKIFNLLHLFGISGQERFNPSYDNLPLFLDRIDNPPSIKMRTDENGERKLEAFQMTAVAQNMSEWSNRAVYVERCRTVLQNYPRFNATVYDGDSAVLDLILTAKKDLIGSIAVTVLCMAIVCLFFIYSKTGVLIVTFTISSICFTLVGSLSWWGADMDPVTMVDVLIATGFSVDYTAHIAYKFYKLDGCRQERIGQSLHEMCGPMLQAGISTVLCMLPLVFVPTYAILAFAKTVFLVVGLGLLHGIFILPVFLTTLCNEDESNSCKGNNNDLSSLTDNKTNNIC